MNPSNLLTASGLAAVNDILMYCEIHGEGLPLILLHGGHFAPSQEPAEFNRTVLGFLAR